MIVFQSDICSRCDQDKQFTKSCIASPVVYPDGEYPPIIFGEEKYYDVTYQNCYDCGVLVGGYHHNWCEAEACGKCGDPLLICCCP